MIVIFGVGNIGQEYARVLSALGVEFAAIGRSERGVQDFKESTGFVAYSGGISALTEHGINPTQVILALPIQDIYEMTCALLQRGVKKIMVEKPGFLSDREIKYVQALCDEVGAEVYVAFNRRFYSTVKKLIDCVESDGGIESCHFEFNERAELIDTTSYAPAILESWGLSNSTHVLDLAFFICGVPEKVSSYVGGNNLINWHARSSKFAGAGVFSNGATFSYCANWNVKGSWLLEIKTRIKTYRLFPLEQLTIISYEGVEECELEVCDREFKPGFYKQTEAFIRGDKRHLCDVSEYLILHASSCEILGY